MTRPATDYNRRRDLDKFKLTAGRMQVQAMLNQRRCEKAGETQDALLWWRIARAQNETIQALNEARGAPLSRQAPALVEPPPDGLDATRDHQGVLKKP